MARYIDADKLIDKLENDKYAEPSTDFQRGINAYIDWLVLDIKYAETVDVVPKSEVDLFQNRHQIKNHPLAKSSKDGDFVILIKRK